MQYAEWYQDLLLDLEEPLGRLGDTVNAMELMLLGLEQAKDPYADGLYILLNCLREAESALHRALSAEQ